MRTISQEKQILSTIISSDGEILDEVKKTEITQFKTDVEPDFIKLYTKDITKLFGLPKSSNSILYQLLRVMDYDNCVALGKHRKEAIANELGITTSTLYNIISIFCKEKIMIRISATEYILNPNLFGKGRWTDIKQLQVLLEYDPSGRKLIAVRKNKEID